MLGGVALPLSQPTYIHQSCRLDKPQAPSDIVMMCDVVLVVYCRDTVSLPLVN